MANTAHLVRRQSSMDLHHQRSIDRVEMRDMRGRLMDNHAAGSFINNTYGATNLAFEDTSPNITNTQQVRVNRGVFES